MPAPTYTVPTNNSDTATEEPKVTIALSDLKALLTGNLDNANIATGGVGYSKLSLTNQIKNADIKSTAAIGHTKLADIPNGHVLAGYAGANTARSLRQLFTALGTLGDVNGLDVNIARDGTTYTSLGVSFTPDAGAHLIVAFTRFEDGTSPGLVSTTLRIRTNTSVTLGTDYQSHDLADGSSAIAVALYDAPGEVQVLADATSGAGSGTVVCKAIHGIVGLPVGDIDNL